MHRCVTADELCKRKGFFLITMLAAKSDDGAEPVLHRSGEARG